MIKNHVLFNKIVIVNGAKMSFASQNGASCGCVLEKNLSFFDNNKICSKNETENERTGKAKNEPLCIFVYF